MIKKRVKTNDGEPLTLEGLMTELNNLFVSHKDDPAAKDIKSMIQSLVNGEACFEEDERSNVDTKCPNSITKNKFNEEYFDIYQTVKEEYFDVYQTVKEAVKSSISVVLSDINNEAVKGITFISSAQMLEGVIETLNSMRMPTIVAYEDGIITKAAILCGKKRTRAHEIFGKLPAFAFDEQNGGMCRLSINRKDGYDFIFGENGVTRFIIFDEEVCPVTIPTDIVKDDRKWGKRMTSELPKLIEKRIEESKSEEKLPFADAVTPALTKIDIPVLDKKTPLCNLPETCEFENCNIDNIPYPNVKKPLIADIMKDFADAKGSGKVGKDTFVEFMKPENKEAVASAVATSIAERQNPVDDVIEKDEVTKAVESALYENAEDDFSDEDTNPDCFRCIAEYMAKEGVDSVHFWTDGEGLIHCDVQLKTVYKVELEDSDKK